MVMDRGVFQDVIVHFDITQYLTNLFLFIDGLQNTNIIHSHPPYKSFLCTRQETQEIKFLR